MTNVLIFGAGSVGACYAYILTKAGVNVTAVCRSNYQVAKERGFTINSGKWGTVHVRPSVVRSVEEASSTEWDFIIVSSKAFPGSRPSVAELIRPAVKPRTAIVLGTAIVLLQNGIGIEDEYVGAFPSSPIISCGVYLPATQTSPGVVKMDGLEFLELGTYPASAPQTHKDAARSFCELVQKGKGEATCYPDIQLLRWKKLIINAPWNPICALSLSNDVALMTATPYGEDLVWKCMLEVVAVANACGYHQLTEADARVQMARATARIPDKGIEPSMLADIHEGRPMEVEAIVGNFIRIAQKEDVRIPYMTMVYALVKALDESNARKRSNKT